MNAIEYDRHRDQPIFMGNDEHQVPKKVLEGEEIEFSTLQKSRRVSSKKLLCGSHGERECKLGYFKRLISSIF